MKRRISVVTEPKDVKRKESINLIGVWTLKEK